MNLRWRVGTFLGNAVPTNEAYAAASNGDVIRTTKTLSGLWGLANGQTRLSVESKALHSSRGPTLKLNPMLMWKNWWTLTPKKVDRMPYDQA